MHKSKKNLHRGNNFDDFLKEEGLYEEVSAAAAKRLIAQQVADSLKELDKSMTDLAKEMKTSRAVIHRLLDEKNDALSLKTLVKAASALGKTLKIELVTA